MRQSIDKYKYIGGGGGGGGEVADLLVLVGHGVGGTQVGQYHRTDVQDLEHKKSTRLYNNIKLLKY